MLIFLMLWKLFFQCYGSYFFNAMEAIFNAMETIFNAMEATF